jgi:preprotein translocase subunit SecY
MNSAITWITTVWSDAKMRKKMLISFGLLFVYRVLTFVPVSLVDFHQIKSLFDSNQFLSLLDIFSGGTLLNFSVIALGLNPYINASIVLQMMTMVFPQLENLQKEGEYGRYKINQYTRLLTLPLTLVQAVGIFYYLKSSNLLYTQAGAVSFLEFISFIATMVAGTYIIVWFGELITEFGLGNGISLLIFAGIVSRLLPTALRTSSIATGDSIMSTFLFVLLFGFVIAMVVFVNQAVRKVPVYYAKRIQGNRVYQAANNFLPLKLNQAGVIPIIFAVSFVLFPQMIGNFLSPSANKTIAAIGAFFTKTFVANGLVYNVLYFVLVILFTFIYTVIVFNPQKIAQEIQKNGGFIPGVRPGTATQSYLQGIIFQLTAVGAVFLGLIAIIPSIISAITGVTSLVIGGTSVLIVVSVVLELLKSIESQVSSRNYDKFL